MAKSREEYLEYQRKWKRDNREKFRESQKRCIAEARMAALAHYGGNPPKCACCGEALVPFLVIDHARGDGAAHRRAIGIVQGSPHAVRVQGQVLTRAANAFPFWLKKNGYPDGFRILCYNCNFAKRPGKYCPHEVERGTSLEGLPLVFGELTEEQEYARNFRRRRRLEVLAKYGGDPPECCCCGERRFEFLSIDHVGGGGTAHLREIGMAGNRLPDWLRKNGYPPGFQILCMSCNSAKHHAGQCPHEVCRDGAREVA